MNHPWRSAWYDKHIWEPACFKILQQRNALQFSFELNRNSGTIYYTTIVNGVPERIIILTGDVSTKKVGEHYERFYGKIIDRIIANVEIRFWDTEHENIEFIISEVFNRVSEMQNKGNKEFEVMLDLYKEIKVYCDKHNLNVEQALNFLRGNKYRLEKESVK